MTALFCTHSVHLLQIQLLMDFLMLLSQKTVIIPSGQSKYAIFK